MLAPDAHAGYTAPIADHPSCASALRFNGHEERGGRVRWEADVFSGHRIFSGRNINDGTGVEKIRGPDSGSFSALSCYGFSEQRD